MKDSNSSTSSPDDRRPGVTRDEELGTTYLSPPLHQPAHPQLISQNHQSHQQRLNNLVHIPPLSHHRQHSDPPARHIREDHIANDEPSSFYVNNLGVMQPAPRRPVLAAAQIVEDEPTHFHQGMPTTTIREDDEMSMDSISIGDAWQRRRGEFQRQGAAAVPPAPGAPIVAVPVEESATHQGEGPSFLEVSQSRILPAHDGYAPHDMPRRRQFAARPVSGISQATVLSEHTWATHDQFRSGLAVADPIYEGGDDEEEEQDQAPVLAAMEQFSSSFNKLQAEEAQAARSQTASQGRLSLAGGRSHSSQNSSNSSVGGRSQSSQASSTTALGEGSLPRPSRLRGRSQSLQSSEPTPPTIVPSRASSEPFAPNGGRRDSNVSVTSSATSGTNSSLDSSERLSRMKKNRVRLQRGAALGGLVVGSILFTPVGAVAAAAGGYAATRLAGRRRERKLREQLEEEDEEEEDCIDDGSTQDEARSEPQDYEIPLNSIFYTQRHDPREDDLEQSVRSRFKAEGRCHVENASVSRLTTASQQSHPTQVSAGRMRSRRNGSG